MILDPGPKPIYLLSWKGEDDYIGPVVNLTHSLHNFMDSLGEDPALEQHLNHAILTLQDTPFVFEENITIPGANSNYVLMFLVTLFELPSHVKKVIFW